MATSTIDGVVEEAKLKRNARGIVIYDEIRFKLDDGSSRTIKKQVLKQPVADLVAPGSRGRFYLFTAFDIKGIHGARLSDGRSAFGFPGNNKTIFLILGIVNLAWIALRILAFGDVPLLGVGLLVLATIGFVTMGRGEKDAVQQYEQDSGYQPPVVH